MDRIIFFSSGNKSNKSSERNVDRAIKAKCGTLMLFTTLSFMMLWLVVPVSCNLFLVAPLKSPLRALFLLTVLLVLMVL